MEQKIGQKTSLVCHNFLVDGWEMVEDGLKVLANLQ